jgi:hypothetical protein
VKKSKWDIIGSDIDKDNQYDYEDFFYWWYDDGDYLDPNPGYGEDYIYEYLEDVYDKYISKHGIRVSFNNYQRGSYIDMMSIYSPGVLRQRKIDYLLGLDKWEFNQKPTIGDLIKYKSDGKYRKINKARR